MEVEDDYLLMSRFTGQDINGRALFNYSVMVSAEKSLPLGR
jgi:hypothetical protein